MQSYLAQMDGFSWQRFSRHCCRSNKIKCEPFQMKINHPELDQAGRMTHINKPFNWLKPKAMKWRLAFIVELCLQDGHLFKYLVVVSQMNFWDYRLIVWNVYCEVYIRCGYIVHGHVHDRKMFNESKLGD